jgi:hypothetical protein
MSLHTFLSLSFDLCLSLWTSQDGRTPEELARWMENQKSIALFFNFNQRLHTISHGSQYRSSDPTHSQASAPPMGSLDFYSQPFGRSAPPLSSALSSQPQGYINSSSMTLPSQAWSPQCDLTQRQSESEAIFSRGRNNLSHPSFLQSRGDESLSGNNSKDGKEPFRLKAPTSTLSPNSSRHSTQVESTPSRALQRVTHHEMTGNTKHHQTKVQSSARPRPRSPSSSDSIISEKTTTGEKKVRDAPQNRSNERVSL